MGTYEDRQEERRQRYLDRAAKSNQAANSLHDKAHQMTSIIPFGQPILVGHHSEGRDRRYREKIHNTFGKAFAEHDKAKYYEDKAEAVGTGGISSDDENAIPKLQAKLKSAEGNQELMKRVNSVIRKYAKDHQACVSELEKLGLSIVDAEKIIQPDCMGRIGFPTYTLQNNNANIRRIKDRIRQLEKALNSQPVLVKHDGFTYKEEDNRCQFVFDGKPAEEIRTILKSHGFKWSPSRGTWVRMLNGNGRYAANRVIEKLIQLCPAKGESI